MDTIQYCYNTIDRSRGCGGKNLFGQYSVAVESDDDENTCDIYTFVYCMVNFMKLFAMDLEKTKKMGKKDYRDWKSVFSCCVWNFVKKFYLKNNKLQSLTVHEQCHKMEQYVMEAASVMNRKKLHACLASIYKRHYLHEMRNVSWQELKRCMKRIELCKMNINKI
ncbi:Hz102-like protein [Clanis bilineata nucleopolyhedrovirus]|uniref:Hz102-like protein n=1 Tax=Clanis bilineata nucleopolyhedrovirus TaxID=1307957 RepID=Q0N403_9ABAC|nr:Hz102-like protein [Clanis bilineata nucleopolyhedrovirus]ABF47440.1 Hz102-like protein [Clanis bilineata nucleopolyhedrovirus]